MLIVAAQQLKAQQLVVAGHEALNLIEDGERIEGRKLRLEILRREPHGMPVGFARLRAAGLTDICAQPALSKWNECVNGMSHLVSEPDDQLEIRPRAGLISSFVDE